nr:putative SPOUT methyltransferase [uncultured bacterium]AIA19051.1 putative SPOUT methyltransferase [uncultured bacterium]
MKLHIVTVGEPKLPYAKAGWGEYLQRLKHYHNIKVTHVADKWAYDYSYLKNLMGSAYVVVLEITGQQFSSPELAKLLEKRSLDSKEICFIIGGPEGLPQPLIDTADLQWSFSKLTFPHDLAMVILLESLYRASTISAGQPYHK